MQSLYFVTHNQHKAEEIAAILCDSPENIAHANFQILSMADLNFSEDIPETASTLEGNALLKAQYVHARYAVNCFADDTGLEVEALDGAPGVYSARYAGENADFEKNIDKLLEALKNEDNRKAKFRTVIALILNHPTHLASKQGEIPLDNAPKIYYFEGCVEGEILRVRQGKEGFGYDAVFRPLGYTQSFAELSMQEKNKISHRGKAVAQLRDFLYTPTTHGH
ncbi:MAG: RdgB/HAM1 family non-canonical purine NTP pyrophosphatase [Bacteroidales bacterium]